MSSFRWGAAAVAAWALSTAACGQAKSSSGGPLAGNGPVDGGARGADGSAASGSTGGDSGAQGTANAGDDAGDASNVSTTMSLVRIANFAPDAPAAGYDVCLAPAGSMTWMGPLLAMSFPAGSLGQGGPNGLQFPTVTAYFPVAPGTYDLQLVASGGTCTTGIIPVTYGLPVLQLGARTTFAIVGDATATNNDAAMKVTAFSDDSSVSSQTAALRIINAIPSIAYIDVGTGSAANGTFSPLVVDVPFGDAAMRLPDGGAPDGNGYIQLAPLSGGLLSAHPTGATGTMNTATASNVTLAAGSVTTMALINGKDGGNAPQFLSCDDDAPPTGSQSACRVIAQ